MLLALLFFVLLGIAFLVFGGMREYFKRSLIDETFEQAGEDILANYDKPLFERYHLFLLDPRETAHIAEDATAGVNAAFTGSGFFQGVESNITLGARETALQENGKVILKQIEDWEACQSIYLLPDMMDKILKGTEKKDSVTEKFSKCDEEASKAEKPKDSPREGEEQEETEEEKRVKNNWKEWKKELSQVLDAGILGYVAPDINKLSKQSLNNSSSLPSKEAGVGSAVIDLDSFSLTQFSKLKKLYKNGVSGVKDQELLGAKLYMIPYILDCFSHYRNSDQSRKHCLNYEMEYLITGRSKDKDNLKYIANQLFMLRFLVNYTYAIQNTKIRSEAASMATVLTGILGFPQGKEIVIQLLTASLCYGESLLEVRALFKGKKLALTKNSSNWNLTFANAVSKLKNKSNIINVSKGADYETYLLTLLVLRASSKKIFYRMMDLMQCNVALEESGFLMKNCLTSFRCNGNFSWTPWFKSIIFYNLMWNNKFSISYSRSFSYQ